MSNRPPDGWLSDSTEPTPEDPPPLDQETREDDGPIDSPLYIPLHESSPSAMAFSSGGFVRYGASSVPGGFIRYGENAAPDGCIAFSYEDGKKTVCLSANGSITFTEGYRPCAAATAFWTHLAVHNPMQDRVRKLEETLRQALDDAPGWRELAEDRLANVAACTLHQDCVESRCLGRACWASLFDAVGPHEPP